MDNLVLTRLAIELDRDLPGAILERFQQQSHERFRLSFARGGETRVLVVSLVPTAPWIGEAAYAWDGLAWSPDAFTVAASRALAGRKVAAVVKDAGDRSLRLDLGDRAGLAIELATHGANLILLREGGSIEASLRTPRRAAERLAAGAVWKPRPRPSGLLDPFSAPADEIDRAVGEREKLGDSPVDALRRAVVGLAPSDAAIVHEEALVRSRTPGQVLRERVDALVRGDGEIVIAGPEDPREAVRGGRFASERFRLLPWRVPGGDPTNVRREPRATQTAGLFHESLEISLRNRARIEGLGGILRQEIRRAREAEFKTQQGIREFEDPGRHARLGEALVAGLSVARREGEFALVPDPYDSEGRLLSVPAPPDRTLTQVVDDLFRRSRRARRGLEHARARAEFLSERVGRLERLAVAAERCRTPAETVDLEAAMRGEGLAVGLSLPTRSARAAAQLAPPKLEGVRIFVSPDGWTVLVGKTARDNDRLTFKIAAPEDIWMHVAGTTGAHVVVRNADRKSDVPPATLAHAASLAAWYSDAKGHAAVDVHWTRRKNVRRARGGPPGRVVLKRFTSMRVRPVAPPDTD